MSKVPEEIKEVLISLVELNQKWVDLVEDKEIEGSEELLREAALVLVETIPKLFKVAFAKEDE